MDLTSMKPFIHVYLFCDSSLCCHLSVHITSWTKYVSFFFPLANYYLYMYLLRFPVFHSNLFTFTVICIVDSTCISCHTIRFSVYSFFYNHSHPFVELLSIPYNGIFIWAKISEVLCHYTGVLYMYM